MEWLFAVIGRIFERRRSNWRQMSNLQFPRKILTRRFRVYLNRTFRVGSLYQSRNVPIMARSPSPCHIRVDAKERERVDNYLISFSCSFPIGHHTRRQQRQTHILTYIVIIFFCVFPCLEFFFSERRWIAC
jgi:hypothetical protein